MDHLCFDLKLYKIFFISRQATAWAIIGLLLAFSFVVQIFFTTISGHNHVKSGFSLIILAFATEMRA